MSGITSNEHAAFHGTLLRSHKVDGFVLSETACAPGLELRQHSHERAGFCVVLQGGFVEYRDRKERLYNPSDIIFRPPGELHANHFLPRGGRCLNIEIARETLQLLGVRAATFGKPADFRDARLSGLAMRIHDELHHPDALSPLALETLVVELLIETARGDRLPGKAPRWLAHVKDLLHERFAEPLSLGQIAAVVDVHPAHLARTFRRFELQTVGDYVRLLRLEFARTQLSTTNESISAIALSAGFFDQGHLSRTFKRQTGMTPSEFRSTFRTGNSRAKLQS